MNLKDGEQTCRGTPLVDMDLDVREAEIRALLAGVPEIRGHPFLPDFYRYDNPCIPEAEMGTEPLG